MIPIPVATIDETIHSLERQGPWQGGDFLELLEALLCSKWALPFDRCSEKEPLGVEEGDLEPEIPFKGMIVEASQRYGLPPALVMAVVKAESNFRPEARSPKGAMGLMQLMPSTAEGLGVEDPFDPRQNVEGGVRYLRQLLDHFGDLKLALAAYNAGPSEVKRHNGIPPYPETQLYVEKVLRYTQEFLLSFPLLDSSEGTSVSMRTDEGRPTKPTPLPPSGVTLSGGNGPPPLSLRYEGDQPVDGRGGPPEGSWVPLGHGSEEALALQRPLGRQRVLEGRQIRTVPRGPEGSTPKELPISSGLHHFLSDTAARGPIVAPGGDRRSPPERELRPFSLIRKEDPLVRSAREAISPIACGSEIPPSPPMREGTSPPAPSPPYRALVQEVVSLIVKKVKVELLKGVQRIDVELKPGFLGGLRIEVEMRQGGLLARITAQTEEAKRIVEAHLTEIQRGLEAQGLRFEQLHLALAAQQETQSLWNRSLQRRRHQQGERRVAALHGKEAEGSVKGEALFEITA